MHLGPVAGELSLAGAGGVGDEVVAFFGGAGREVVDRFVERDGFAAEVAEDFEGRAVAWGLVHSDVHNVGKLAVR